MGCRSIRPLVDISIQAAVPGRVHLCIGDISDRARVEAACAVTDDADAAIRMRLGGETYVALRLDPRSRGY